MTNLALRQSRRMILSSLTMDTPLAGSGGRLGAGPLSIPLRTEWSLLKLGLAPFGISLFRPLAA